MVAVAITEKDGRVVVEFDPLAKVRVHPAADLFPLLEGKEFEKLIEDIRECGLREPIVYTADGQLLDGRGRLRACAHLGIECESRVEHGEPWEWCIRQNMLHRDLSSSQRAMIGARMMEYLNSDNRDVYFIQSLGPGSPIKIGVTKDPRARLAQLQTASPYPLSLIGVIPKSGRRVEADLHRRFGEYRITGEWFEPSKEIVDYIMEASS